MAGKYDPDGRETRPSATMTCDMAELRHFLCDAFPCNSRDCRYHLCSGSQADYGRNKRFFAVQKIEYSRNNWLLIIILVDCKIENFA